MPTGLDRVPSVEEELAQRLGRGEEVVLATVIKLDGEPPSQPGAKLLMSRTAPIAGTLGCSEFDSAAVADADAIAAGGSPQLRTYRHDLGSIEVYLEPYAASPTLVIFAATPVARALAGWAPELGFRTVALEAVLPLNPRFIGLVGSRRHTGHHLEALRAKGVSDDVISRIQSPVGLDLGGRTAAEIALSILAGLVAVRRGGKAGWKSRIG
ncbi:MAG: hypothetical protein E6J06_05115 [Chloroflexi bacterium]|nr:MAG: hypothetical protein E6J06_05115 [Chloroflexota bacterium]